MGVRGDFRELAELRQRFARLGKPQFRDGLTRTLAEAAVTQIDREFRASQDPYGVSWKPSVNKGGHTLFGTGNLRNSLAPKFSGTGFTIRTAVKYAAVHQYGATIKPKNGKYLRFRGPYGFRTMKQVTIPRRQYMPESELGPAWTKAFNGAADDFMRIAMGRR